MATAACAAEPTAADLARQILDTTLTRGGLVVHLGCGDGKLTAALCGGDGYLVHGLDTDAGSVDEARRHIRSLGLYGQVSVDRLPGERLPYAESVVNLVVVSSAECRVPEEEILRVLVPNGVALVKIERDEPGPGGLAGFRTLQKPWPAEIDEWTHYLHGPDGNQVAADTVVGPPVHVKWLAKPYWGREHRYGNKTAMVSARGRLFYVGNDVQSSIEVFPDRPLLIARDAFNGVLLWKHPIFPRSVTDRMPLADDPEEYLLHEPPFPMELKVVAIGDTLCVAFGRSGEIQLLDAAGGNLIKVYEGTENTQEILYDRGTLLTVAGPGGGPDEATYSMADFNDAIFIRERAKVLRAVDFQTGRTLWEYDTGPDGGLGVSPVTDEGRVFTVVGNDLVRLDLATGDRLWRRPLPIDDAVKKRRLRSAIYIKGPAIYDHLIATEDVVILAYLPDSKPTARETALLAFSSETGKKLWSHACWSPQRAGASVFVVGDRVWVHGSGDNKNLPLVALDVHSGEEKERLDATETFNVGHHHRCYGNRATERFVLTGRRGVEFIDLDAGDNWLHHWVRGKCRFGVLPCNGLLYALPHACSCYPLSTLKGYSALAAAQQPQAAAAGPDEGPRRRLEKGPAYGKVGNEATASNSLETSGQWPTHRHDGRRSGSTPEDVKPDGLSRVWGTSLGATPTGLTAAGGRLFVSTPDTHEVHALEMESGRVLWSFVAGGRVDSPPTLHAGLVLFGSADGYVYCLRARDGSLVWRFLAAPRDRRICAYGRLESVWPVHGAVLVRDGKVYFSAGRSSLLDGGISVYALEARTGKVVSQNRIHDAYAQAETAMLDNTGHDYDGKLGVLQDILIADDAHLYLKQLQLDEHCVPTGRTGRLISTNGLLNPAWLSRFGWFFSGPNESRSSNAASSRYDPLESPRQGQYLVFDDALTYSVRVHPNIGKFRQSFVPGEKGYRIFADDNKSAANRWNIFVPIRVEAMVAAAGNTLYLAGSPDQVDREDPWGAIEGRKGGLLWAVSADDGKKLAELRIDRPPVFDGLIAAGGRLFLSLTDGEVICLKGK
jgi:outer membrane protein assembly factor BamB